MSINHCRGGGVQFFLLLRDLIRLVWGLSFLVTVIMWTVILSYEESPFVPFRVMFGLVYCAVF